MSQSRVGGLATMLAESAGGTATAGLVDDGRSVGG
jgi:hypothetical protein